MKRWSVYAIRQGSKGPYVYPIGYVNAPHGPGAVAKAVLKWPNLARPDLPQLGFSVKTYTRDIHPLGKLHQGAKTAPIHKSRLTLDDLIASIPLRKTA